ncbi:MAG: tetratricopeptide repeat protein [Spirochaetota bacterium]
MNLTSEFSYSNISQRRLVLLNAFFSFLIGGFMLSDLILRGKYLFPYAPIGNDIILLLMAGFLAGNIVGQLLFSRLKQSRYGYLIVEILFLLTASAYIGKEYLSTETISLPVLVTLHYPYSIHMIAPFLGLIVGIKSIYFLKISSGDYIDEKNPILLFIALSIAGITSGIILNGVVATYYTWYPVIFAALPVVIATMVYINLPYNPVPMYTREPGKVYEEQEDKTPHSRDDIFFTYLNFSYIATYSIFLYYSFIKYYGFFPLPVMLFISAMAGAILLGLGLNRLLKNAFWHVYSEMLYPLLFIAVFIILSQYSNTLDIAVAALVVAIPAVMFGFSLANNISHISLKHDHKTRFSILNFSLYIIPIPIMMALFWYVFTYRWFFITFYVMALLNVLLPGLYLFQHKKGALKKGSYFVFSLVFVPLLITLHINFKIPLNNDLFVQYSKGYNTLTRINYNAEFITRSSQVRLQNVLACKIHNISVRNLKRALFPVKLYAMQENSSILFLDGYQKFFKNPVPGVNTEELYCTDYIPDRNIDYQRLAVTGKDQYISNREYVLETLSRIAGNYEIIVDMPNIFDQQVNRFRFNPSYTDIISDRLTPDGIFMQVYDVARCDPGFLEKATSNVRQKFTHTVAFLFGNYLVYGGTDRPKGFLLEEGHINNMRQFLKNHEKFSDLFLDTEHFLSHMIETAPNTDTVELDPGYPAEYMLLKPPHNVPVKDNKYLDLLTSGNDMFMKLVDNEHINSRARYSLSQNLSQNNAIYTLLKLSEVAELKENYEEETELLFKLRRIADYRYELRQYIDRILAFKEYHYRQIARNYEKEKQWEKAVHLYNAILTINPDNFQANYRLGTLNITLQNMDLAYQYLTHAMKLDNKNPRVPYQIGILLLSQGKFRESLEYLSTARNLQFKSASLYLYTGLCHESLGNLQESKKYYEMALKLDPSDGTITSSLERINEKIETEKTHGYIPAIRKNQNEDELGESIPIPINKSAFEIRLSDDEASDE